MAQDRLYELIHSLSQSEKRYFKQYLNRFSNNSSIYARLFDYLSQSKKYDRDILLKKCDFIKPSQFQNIRTRLYDYILESLRAYKSNSSHTISIHELMINYEILLNKSLFVQAWKLLIKAEQLARSSEIFYLIEDILIKQEYLATTRLKDKKIVKLVKTIEQKRIEVLSMKNTMIKIKNLHTETYSIFKQDGRITRGLNGMETIVKELESLKSEVAQYPDTYRINYEYHKTIATAHGHCGNFNAAMQHMKKIISFFNENKKYIQLHIREYLYALNRLIIDQNTNEKFDEALETIHEMRTIANTQPKNKELQLMAFENANFQELEIYIKKKSYPFAVNFMEEFIPNIDAMEDKIHTVNQQSKFYRIGLAYFANGDYHKALQWINKILNTTQSNYRKDILSSIQILNLLIHYELEHYSLLTYRITSITNYLKKINRYLPFEKGIINTLRRIVSHGINEKKAFQQLYSDLKEIENNLPMEKYAMAYFDLGHWLLQKTK